MRLKLTLLIVSCISFSGTAYSTTQGQHRNAFLKADVDGDKQLTKAEFKTFLGLLAEAGNSKAKRVVSFGERGYAKGFERADSDANGLLTPVELERLR